MTFGLQLGTSELAVGIVMGLSYALLGMGLVLIYRTTRVIHFGYGEIGAFGALIVAKLVLDHGWSWWTAVPLAIGIGAAVSAAWERTVVRRLFDAASPRAPGGHHRHRPGDVRGPAAPGEGQQQRPLPDPARPPPADRLVHPPWRPRHGPDRRARDRRRAHVVPEPHHLGPRHPRLCHERARSDPRRGPRPADVDARLGDRRWARRRHLCPHPPGARRRPRAGSPGRGRRPAAAGARRRDDRADGVAGVGRRRRRRARVSSSRCCWPTSTPPGSSMS